MTSKTQANRIAEILIPEGIDSKGRPSTIETAYGRKTREGIADLIIQETEDTVIDRGEFEVAGFRVIPIAKGEVVFSDNRRCRYSVRLRAEQGSEGDIKLVVEDFNNRASPVSTPRKLKCLKCK